MNAPIELSEPNRCSHLDANSRRCRMTVSPTHATLCGQHALAERQAATAAHIAARLTHPAMKTPAEINAVLAELFTAVSRKKVDLREAALLAYIAQLMLQTLKAPDPQPALPK